jgi:hypothetical protein
MFRSEIIGQRAYGGKLAFRKALTLEMEARLKFTGLLKIYSRYIKQ